MGDKKQRYYTEVLLILFFSACSLAIFLNEAGAQNIFFEEAISQSMKQQAISLAFKEQAMRQAFQEAEIKTLEKRLVPHEGFFSFLSAIHPYFSLDTTYDENIFLTDSRQDDWVNKVTPGLRFGLGRTEPVSDAQRYSYRFELDLGTNNFYYLRHTNLNREEPYIGVYYLSGKGTRKFKFQHNYNDTYALNSSLVTAQTGVSRYIYNSTIIDFEASRKHLGFNIGYNRDSSNYKKDYKISNSIQEQVIILKGFLQAFPKTRFFTEYNYDMIEYTKAITKDNDSDTHKFWLGATGDFSKKTRGNVKFGYEIRDNKNGTSDQGNTVDVDVSYKYSPKTSFIFKANQGLKDTTLTGEGFDKTYGYSLSCNYTLNSKVSFNFIFVNFTHDKYTSGRKDDSFESSLELDYNLLKWWTVLVKYSHMERESSELNGGYIDNLYTIRTKAEF